MPLTKRQVLYREYLKTDHWKDLRAKAIDRDGGECLRCGSKDKIQVHHTKYRGRMEDTLLEDLETLCRTCHRLEHGIGPLVIEIKYREIKRYFGYAQRPPPALWKEFRAEMVGCAFDLEAFAELMMWYVRFILQHEERANNPTGGTSFDPARDLIWWRKARRIQNSILSRIEKL